MSTVTLDQIKAAQEKLNAMIASFESTKIEDMFPINIGMPQLNDGEKWLGVVISANGTKKEHVILLPGDKDDIKWQDAADWAQSIGGYLPDRIEQAMLYKCMPDEFEKEAYWSCEQHASNAEWAWCQNFTSRNQHDTIKHDELRARAVRRISVI